MKIRLNPKIAFIGWLFISTLIIFVKDIYLSSLFLIIILVLSAFTKTKRKLRERIYPLVSISLMVVFFQLIFNFSLDLSQRLIAGITAGEKIISLSLIVFIFTSLTSLSKIVEIFSFLPSSIQLMLTITFSLIPVILDESKKIMMVQLSKGHKMGKLNIFRNLPPIIVPLIHRSLKRAEQIGLVLEARGYHG